MKKLVVKLNNNQKNIKISKYICDIYKNVPYSIICKAFRNKDIRVNGIKVSSDSTISNGDVLEIYISDNILFGIPSKLDYYYIDDNIAVVYKKKGLLSNNEHNDKLDEPTFEDIVKSDLNSLEIKICHRLDRNTDGLVIFAKNSVAYNELFTAFKNGLIKKEYIAYVAGSNFSKSHSIIEAFLLKDPKASVVKISKLEIPYSQKITTEYDVLNTNNNLDYAKLNVILHTGKTHQIRAHLASINHPIIGDSKYGKNEINKKFKKSKQMLTAYKYSFKFPKTSIMYYLNNIKIELPKEKIEML